MGKNDAMTTTVTPVQKPRPTISVMIGAIATTGTLRIEMAKGNVAWAVAGETTNTPAVPIANTVLIASPQTPSPSVNSRWPKIMERLSISDSSAACGNGIRYGLMSCRTTKPCQKDRNNSAKMAKDTRVRAAEFAQTDRQATEYQSLSLATTIELCSRRLARLALLA